MCNKLELKGRYWTRLPVSRTWTLVALFILGKARGYKNRRRIPDQRSHSAALIDVKIPPVIHIQRLNWLQTWTFTRCQDLNFKSLVFNMVVSYFVTKSASLDLRTAFGSDIISSEFHWQCRTFGSNGRNRVSLYNIPSSNYCSANLIRLYSVL